MNHFWWQLPGPHHFVSKIARTLREGKNVVISLPEYAPEGLSQAIRETLGESTGWFWHTLDTREDDGVMPAQLLCSRFVPEISPDAILNAHTLSREESFAGKIIWLAEMTPNAWPAWKDFIADYAHACRARSLLDRTLFCVPLVGELALDAPLVDDVCLARHRWSGVVDHLDMLLFTSSLFQNRPMPVLQKRLAVAIVANLALWDPAVSERVASETIEQILHPIPILREIAAARRWSPPALEVSSCSWHKGMIETLEGGEKIHSAALAGLEDAREIERRIWSAEVGVMLPFVEEKRQEILAQFAGVLKVPITTRSGEVITDLRDLEIGHIESQLTNNGTPIDPARLRLVQRLREIRNCLSHLVPLASELALDDELSAFSASIA